MCSEYVPSSRGLCVAVGSEAHPRLVLMLQLFHLRLQLRDHPEEKYTHMRTHTHALSQFKTVTSKDYRCDETSLKDAVKQSLLRRVAGVLQSLNSCPGAGVMATFGLSGRRPGKAVVLKGEGEVLTSSGPISAHWHQRACSPSTPNCPTEQELNI